MNRLTPKKLGIPVAAAIVMALLAGGTAIAAFTAARTVSVAVDADSVRTGATPAVTTDDDVATITFADITLDSDRAVLGYELRRNGGTIISCAASPCTDTGLSPGSYSYEVRGVYRSWTGGFGPASGTKTIATPDLSFTSSSASCATGSVTLPAGTTSWTSEVSRSYATSAGATSVTVARTAGSGSLAGSPLTIDANATESTGSITLSGLTDGATATVTASATSANPAECDITVASPSPSLTVTASVTQFNPSQGRATFSGTGAAATGTITVTVYTNSTCTTTHSSPVLTHSPTGAGAWGPTGASGNLAEGGTFYVKAVQGSSSSTCVAFSVPVYP